MTILAQICEDKIEHVRRMSHLIPAIILQERIKECAPTRGFYKNLAAKKNQGTHAIIAEIKKASPSKGIISQDFDPTKIARFYTEMGASCISVLTDSPYFKGQDEDLEAAHFASSLPILRKDFMLEEYQIYESRALGADCVLLIMAAVNDEMAMRLFTLATFLGMDVLVEVHDESELERALKLNPRLIGINCRNLKTLELNKDIFEILAAQIPTDVLKIAESGIETRDELRGLKNLGYNAFLIGESFMKDPALLKEFAEA